LKELKKNLASCRYASGEHEAAIRLYRNLIKYSHDKEYIYNIYNTLIRHLMSSSRWSDALAYIKEYLADTELVDIGSDNPSLLGEMEFLRFKCSDISRDVDLLRNMGMSRDPETIRNGSMLALLAANSMMNFDPFSRYYTYVAINYADKNSGFPDLEKALALAVGMFAAEGEFEYANSIFEASIAFAERNNLPKSKLLAVYSASLAHFRHPFNEIMPVYQKARQTARLEGDYYFTSFMDVIILSYSLFSGVRLAKISRDVDAAAYNAEKNGLVDFKNIFKILYKQFIRCMNGSTYGLDTFDDNTFCEAEFIETTGEVSWNFISLFYYPHRMQALFTHGFYTEMLEYSSGIKLNYVDNEQRALYYNRMKYLFYQSMAIIKLCENDYDFQGEHLSRLYGNNDRLKGYAEANPTNFGPPYRLIELEIRKLSGLRLSYIGEYNELSMEFKKLGHYYERAIIDESLARLWTLKYKIEHYREIQTQKALEVYRAIGAKAKVKMLSGDKADLTDKSSIGASIVYPTASIANTGTFASASMDYSAILELISLLASDSDLDEMSEDLLSVLIKSAVSDQALLLLNNKEEMELYNFRYAGDRTGALSSLDLPANLSHIEKTAVPHKLIDYVKEKKTAATANSAENEYGFLGDPYLAEMKPESFLCMPVLTNNELLGVIYLENSHLPGIFPAGRVNFLNYIITQSGLLIKNALNVRSVTDHNIELEKRLNSHTKQLNTLIGGIAHEINTPLGICVTIVTDLMKQVSEVITAYQNGELSKSELDEYFEENAKGLEILLGNITRATNLIQNFKKITVNQTASTVENVDIIREINNIVDYARPAIKNIVGACNILGPEKLRMYTSFGALAQVLTNMIMNSALHAFEGMQKADCRIDIEIIDERDNVSIIYRDNGRGMTKEENEHFFIPFFTMRRADGGSGLGGHIILSTVTQTLGGTIHLTSAPGYGCTFNIKLPKN
ncbi:MAG: GAF domain-containing sensor histidine kinase, partial [Oscillospiraceae bacterium]|nr:GAF domain-containing sensor histidine kinase [Oscillospiraceae bacterium]